MERLVKEYIDMLNGNGNASDKFWELEERIKKDNSGSVGKTFYHKYEFIASDHVTALKSDRLNEYSYLFVATIVQRLENKYSFNREINDMRINKEKLYFLLMNLTNRIMLLWNNMSDNKLQH